MLVVQRNYDLHYCLMSNKKLYHILLYFLNFPITPQYNTLIQKHKSINENNDSWLYNFKKRFDEIQSTYLAMNRLVSLLSVAITLKTAKHPVTVISESSYHWRTLHFYVLILCLIKLKNKNNILTRLVVWSDGSAVQFVWKFVFIFWSSDYPNVILEW